VAWVAAEEHAFTFGMQRVTRPCDKQQCADEPHKGRLRQRGSCLGPDASTSPSTCATRAGAKVNRLRPASNRKSGTSPNHRRSNRHASRSHQLRSLTFDHLLVSRDGRSSFGPSSSARAVGLPPVAPMIRVVIRAMGDPADDGEAEHKPD